MPGHTCTWGVGLLCTQHLSDRNGACQQVKILTATLSLHPGAVRLIPSGSVGLFENTLIYG